VAEPRWLEVSLTVDEELAEAVAEVLARFSSQGGVAMEQAVNYDAYEIEGQPVGPVRVFGYLVVNETIEETRQRLEEALWHLSRIQPLPAPVYRWVEDQDWMEAWKQHYHPLPIGARLLVAPPWAEIEAGDRVVVRIDPSMAFGTGTHPSTQLSLELLERYLQPGQEVIDVGCGSGILSIAAVKLGARQALAVDIDPASVRATDENSGDSEGSFIEVAEKSMMWLKFKVMGKQTHASMPGSGINAHKIGMMFALSVDEALHDNFSDRDELFEPPFSTLKSQRKKRTWRTSTPYREAMFSTWTCEFCLMRIWMTY